MTRRRDSHQETNEQEGRGGSICLRTGTGVSIILCCKEGKDILTTKTLHILIYSLPLLTLSMTLDRRESMQERQMKKSTHVNSHN